MKLTSDIKAKAIELGFDLIGVSDASPVADTDIQRFNEWLDAGYEADMSWLHNNIAKRMNPAEFMPGAKSVIVVGLCYKIARDDLAPRNTDVPQGRVVSYAQYQDYHPFIKTGLGKLAKHLTDRIGELKFRICVDSVPLLERAFAYRAGLGFIGKNHMLINPKLGVQILLGELVTNLELAPDEPIKGDCGDCHKCLDACPTGALRLDGGFDASRCINYLTIEHKGEIADELADKMADRIFGCEECITACPYHQKGRICGNTHFERDIQREKVPLDEIIQMTEDKFCKFFGGSAVERYGLAKLQRNAHICLKNAK